MERVMLLLICCLTLLTACGEEAPSIREKEESLPSLSLYNYEKDAFARHGDRITYVGARFGIDVSRHQGEIDWAAVASDGVEFVILRAGYRGYTQGGIHMDPNFPEYLQGASTAGLDVGAYFFSQAVSVQEAAEEAAFLLEALDGAELQLPVYYDWEPINKEARTDGISGSVITDCAAEFCRIVEQAGYTAGVYFNRQQAYTFYRLEQLNEYDFWFAHYADAPDFPYEIDMWQYADSGKVKGIAEPVDLNLRF